jgi:dolichyl-diphosphooligosaccharide--protein glycosyltransferase
MNAGEIQSLLADAPELRSALEAIRDVDREQETWTFDDIPVDSGAFGELVSEGVVESVDEEYRLADPEAVDRALDGEADTETDVSESFEISLPDIDRTATGLLACLLVLTAAVRASNYPSVFRDRVVYAANGPYAYVYVVERGLQGGWSPHPF